MPGPRPRSFMKPKKGTVKRLMKSLWENYKLGLIISFVSLTLSIGVNLCGSIFASLITEVLYTDFATSFSLSIPFSIKGERLAFNTPAIFAPIL